MKLRRVLTWKSWYYKVALPILRRLGPEACDAALGAIGRMVAAGPRRRRAIASASNRARWGQDPNGATTRATVAATLARASARDYLLDGLADDDALARFDVTGAGHLDEALARGRGVVVVGCHLGAHLPGLHWLYRRGVPLRSLVQRPWHVSRELSRRFDLDGPHPQSGFFLRREMTPVESVDRILRARSASARGWRSTWPATSSGPARTAEPGALLGVNRTFLGVWADLAALARAPVVFLFAVHRPGGRYALTLDEPRIIEPGRGDSAVAGYLRRLEGEIAANPAEAVAYLLRPGFEPPASPVLGTIPGPGRRVAVAH